MATVSTGQVVRRGLALPAIRSVGGYFASKNRYDTAWGDLMLAIFTPVGSRPGQRDFGSALHRVLFETDVIRKQQLVRHIVEETAVKWVPHIVIRHVLVRLKNKVLMLEIAFNLKDDEFLDERLVEIPRDIIIKTLSAYGLG